MLSLWDIFPVSLLLLSGVVIWMRRGHDRTGHAPGRAVYAELCGNVARLLGQVPAGAPRGPAFADAAWEEHRTLFRRAPELHDAIARAYEAVRAASERPQRDLAWLDVIVDEGLPAAGAAAGMSEDEVLLSIVCLVNPVLDDRLEEELDV